MTPLGIVSMIFFLGVTWGGFALLLAFAIRRESRKRAAEQEPAP